MAAPAFRLSSPVVNMAAASSIVPSAFRLSSPVVNMVSLCGLVAFIACLPLRRRRRRRRGRRVVAVGARGARCCHLPCKIQNSKFGRGCGQILNFAASGLNRRRSSSSRRRRRFFLAKLKIQNLAADAAKFRILIFATSGLDRRRRRVGVVASPSSFFLAKLEQNQILAAGSGQILNC